ncbi:hypothetical protein BJ878DRAFT_569212 [Calycina marina]|uniref:Uncharacterized protein n=1 Tax=Calycina marina TaxID=1763456 RepID=A0A9P8CD15_9HELO|nr:hypothetical protein BJ878DRAFT_569212 [Calycina marina]
MTNIPSSIRIDFKLIDPRELTTFSPCEYKLPQSTSQAPCFPDSLSMFLVKGQGNSGGGQPAVSAGENQIQEEVKEEALSASVEQELEIRREYIFRGSEPHLPGLSLDSENISAINSTKEVKNATSPKQSLAPAEDKVNEEGAASESQLPEPASTPEDTAIAERIVPIESKTIVESALGNKPAVAESEETIDIETEVKLESGETTAPRAGAEDLEPEIKLEPSETPTSFDDSSLVADRLEHKENVERVSTESKKPSESKEPTAKDKSPALINQISSSLNETTCASDDEPAVDNQEVEPDAQNCKVDTT